MGLGGEGFVYLERTLGMIGDGDNSEGDFGSIEEGRGAKEEGGKSRNTLGSSNAQKSRT